MSEPEDRWEPHPVDVIHLGGPERIYDDTPKPSPHAPVGFAPPAHDRTCICAACDPAWAAEKETL